MLLKRSLIYYWRTNLAVVVGVAVAVAVLAGALLVGDSVRASLRDTVLLRLGRADYAISAEGFFREQLAADLQAHDGFAANEFGEACGLIALDGSVTHEESGRRANSVQVYGVDERFWKFHERTDEAVVLGGRDVAVGENLADELGIRAGDSVLLRIEKPSVIPVESLHGRKDDVGRTLRLSAREHLPASALGEFSLRPQQTSVHCVFVPLGLLQRELAQEGKINTILVSEKRFDNRSSEAVSRTKVEHLKRILQDKFALEDLGIKLRTLESQNQIALESDSALVGDSLAQTARETAGKLGMRSASILTYLANAIRFGEREVPYSVVTAVDDESFDELRPDKSDKESDDVKDASAQQSSSLAPIILNDWTAGDLGVRFGDAVTLEYYLWQEDGRLETKSAQFQVAGVVPITGAAADRDLVPEYPGITGSESVADWNPPFPVDLKRIRPVDEDYWDKFRTTPKAFVPLTVGQELWQSRFGKLTSLRIIPSEMSEPPAVAGGCGSTKNPPATAGGSDYPLGLTHPLTNSATQLQASLVAYRENLRAALDPSATGFNIYPARAEGLQASRGATDFGEYFLYFSFFLVASALLLAALFFKLGIEQRLREIGILQAIGFSAGKIRTLFLAEGIILSILGTLVGLAGALVYGALIMHGLRTWWVGAVGTTTLTLHASPFSLALGGASGIIVALCCIAWTLRKVAGGSTRGLLTGVIINNPNAPDEHSSQSVTSRARSVLKRVKLFSAWHVGIVCSLLGVSLLLVAMLGWVGQVAGFFGGGTLVLVALLCYQAAWLRGRRVRQIQFGGWWSIARLGLRNATHRPGRSILCIALIASAAFIIVSVNAFRRDETHSTSDRKSGSGGFPLFAESLLPIVHDPNTAEGREALNLIADEYDAALSSVRFTRFRVRPGDDASCLNLYQPRNPRILAPTDEFINSNRFTFQSSLARTSQEQENPWLLLNGEAEDDTIPVIADANSMTYVLHRKLGEQIILNQEDGAGAIRLKLVGALSDSVLQGELLMSEKNFLRLFPEQEGYRFFLIDLPTSGESDAFTARLEERLTDFGFDVSRTSDRLADFHRVENTFISTFQMLGGLGLVLGTLGLAAILLRNVLERRRELALLRAVGYNKSHFALMVIAENLLLLLLGLATGTLSALLAIAPVVFTRGGRLPTLTLGLLLLAVLGSGLIASLLATITALRSPLLPALRAE
ncbi:MAG: ABC transporter permease [Pyrinomonadaceae bacterium MAG19_C2-C3]|nr:ABC transporter permease [Pyrinomonadaceae bacterium MAG19_C2-C3]